MRTKMKMKITRREIDRIEAPAQGYSLVWDSELPNFGLRVTAAGTKSYFVQRRIDGRDRRITVGRVEVYAPEEARNEARKVLGKIASGVDPLAERAKRDAQSVTLAEATEAYLEARRGLKPATIRGIRRAISDLGELANKAIPKITADMVEHKHAELGKRGPALANLTMRYMRAILNFASEKYLDASGISVLPDNPVRKLSRRKAWYRVERRESFIKPHELKSWVRAVLALDFTEASDYLLFVLLTGLRRNEALGLRWSDIDIGGKTLTIANTKNYRAHTLPLSDYLLDMLKRRKADAEAAHRQRTFVFEGPHGKLSNLRYALNSVQEASGVTFCIHDLRRTFATVADSLDVPAYALKALMNHKSGNDVTAGYVRVTVERLRAPMQKITDYFLAAGGIRQGAQVVSIKKRARQ